MPVVRSAGLRGLRATIAELGGNAEKYALLAGLPIEALDGDDLLVEGEAAATVLEIAAHELDCPDLGLRVAARQDFGMLGPLALAIQNSPTIGDALECTSRYLFVHAEALSLSLVDDPYGTRGIVAVHYGVTEPLPDGLPFPIQATDMGLGFLHRAIGFLANGPYGLRTVELPYRPPGPIAAYESFFGVPVRVGRPAALLRVPLSLASQPLTDIDTNVRQLALAFLAERAPEAPNSLAPRVHSAVQQSLGTTPPEIASVARLLALHPRTLQRRLAAEGTSFAAIVDDVRRNAASRYLTTTDMPMSQVAGLLGLSEQSALTRCCRRWWNTTPSAVRHDPTLVTG
ncbi:AraC family transcriptional regulator [Luteipulveratus mongoliensis]|uniref:Transcriptional regulator n=1 Tax=Luteipulveratus mongoliensis TaxID=571913 RepID=A0A0K1JPE8_9MICO|nr:AraC family transcriptional regulator [Luteipulveratus mongoliensis]AKU18597.1 transcriptional regulator [Luteipulveratus mongoliensis]